MLASAHYQDRPRHVSALRLNLSIRAKSGMISETVNAARNVLMYAVSLSALVISIWLASKRECSPRFEHAAHCAPGRQVAGKHFSHLPSISRLPKIRVESLVSQVLSDSVHTRSQGRKNETRKKKKKEGRRETRLARELTILWSALRRHRQGSHDGPGCTVQVIFNDRRGEKGVAERFASASVKP